MEQDNTILISKWMKKSQLFLKKVEEEFKKIDLSTSDLPKDIYDSEKPISLVFVGQYSAGKSTILRALTKIETIEIGEKITTQVTKEYEWNNLKVIDTPGIHTTLRPDHDEISYEAIVNADILVYVVTHELFDSYIGQNFKKLLLEKNKAGEIILVVNKMATVGNTKENREIKRLDLKKVTEPYSPEDLRTCFIDAESYIDSLEEKDEEISNELYNRSNYEELVDTINIFVEQRGYYSKLTTSLQKIADIIQRSISFSSDTGNIGTEERELLDERKNLLYTKINIQQSIKDIYYETENIIRDKGRNLANRLYDFENESEAKEEINNVCTEVKVLCDKCKTDILLKLEKISEEYIEKNIYEFNSENINDEIELKNYNKNKKSITNNILNSDYLKKGCESLFTSVGNSGFGNLKSSSGSPIHQVILKIGEVFEYDFKPWEAVRWANNINKGVKAAAVLGVVFSYGMEMKEEIDNDNRLREMQSNREKIRGAFNKEASKFSDNCNKFLNNYINREFTLEIEKIDNKIDSIRKKRNTEIKKYPLNEASNEKKEPDSTEIISIKAPTILLLGSSLCKKESEGL